MDDVELTQEILDQFDLICTQHQFEYSELISFSNINRIKL